MFRLNKCKSSSSGSLLSDKREGAGRDICIPGVVVVALHGFNKHAIMDLSNWAAVAGMIFMMSKSKLGFSTL